MNISGPEPLTKQEREWQAADLKRLRELKAENHALREALEGMLDEWDRFTRYGSPMAKAANERIAFARAALKDKPCFIRMEDRK
jgi:hypothetical protein